jgi:colicin import membrane protein
VASKEAKTAEAKKKAAKAAKAEAAGVARTKTTDTAITKAAEAAKTKAAESAKAKAARNAEAVTPKKDADGKGKALIPSKAPRQGAKEGHKATLIQSPVVEEVVNEPVSPPAPTSDFSGLRN